jgi:hypothetical protein
MITSRLSERASSGGIPAKIRRGIGLSLVDRGIHLDRGARVFAAFSEGVNRKRISWVNDFHRLRLSGKYDLLDTDKRNKASRKNSTDGCAINDVLLV